ncbi:MAG: AraC family transcriptional regulator [Pygmaiobacter sp.]|nr:AraC family transcriptional regulator [Pygmaiobacter sp.]
MIFEPTALCGAGERLHTSGTQPVALQAGLWLVSTAAGHCACAPPQGDPFLLEKGQLLLAGGPLTLYPTIPCTFDGVRFEGSLAQTILATLAAPVAEDETRCPGVAQTLHQLAGQELPPTPPLLFDLLCLVSRLDEAPAPAGRLAAQAIAAMRHNYASLYGVQELSDALGVSKSHLVRTFREETGTTPGRYLTAVRIEAAKQLLRSTDAPLELVASLAGFSSANYLCRVFHTETGSTPAAFRAAADHSPNTLKMDEIYV